MRTLSRLHTSGLVALGTVAAGVLAATVGNPAAAIDLVPPAPPIPVPYVSPFGVTGINPAWTADLPSRALSYVTGETASGEQTTYPARADWYDNSNTHWFNSTNASYGPLPYVLPQPAVPPGLTADQTLEFYRQRIVQAAVDYIGTPYQHHHIPAWNPFVPQGPTPAAIAVEPPYPTQIPAGQWAWNPVSDNAQSQQFGPVLTDGVWTMTASPQFTNTYRSAYGLGAGGIDCSDLTSLVYSLAAGIFLYSDVGLQGVVNGAGTYTSGAPLGWNSTAVPQPVPASSPTNPSITSITPQFLLGPNSVYSAGGNSRGVSTWNRPGSLDSIVSQLEPGDLLYITNDTGPGNFVTHVVIWLGVYGTVVSPSGATLQVPLVISSHDNTPVVLDANAQLPPLYPDDEAGNMPPPGVHILPFAQNSWFYSNFSHAMRVLIDGQGQAVGGSPLQFGSHAPGSASQPLNATVINTGTAPVGITGRPVISGPSAGQFLVGPGGTCTGILAPGASCTVPVTFNPTATGPQTASLQVPVAAFATSTPSTVSVSLTGTGAASTPARRAQSITFSPSASVPLADRALPLSATATSGLPVTISSTTPDVCTVTGTSATLLASGACGLVASQSGSAAFLPAPSVSATVTVTGPVNPDQRPTGNPTRPVVLAPGLVLVSAGTADATVPRILRSEPSSRPDRAPVVRVTSGTPTALVVPGLAAGTSLMARVRVDGRTVPLGRVQVSPSGAARLPVFTLARAGDYTVVLIDPDSGERSFITVRVGRGSGRDPAPAA